MRVVFLLLSDPHLTKKQSAYVKAQVYDFNLVQNYEMKIIYEN